MLNIFNNQKGVYTSMINWQTIIGWVTLALFVLGIFVYLYKYIASVDKNLKGEILKKMDAGFCNQKYGELKGRLDKGDEKFQSIDKKLDNLIIGLTKVDVTLKLLARKNGVQDE